MSRNESETLAELISPKLTLDSWGANSRQNIEHSNIRREVRRSEDVSY